MVRININIERQGSYNNECVHNTHSVENSMPREEIIVTYSECDSNSIHGYSCYSHDLSHSYISLKESNEANQEDFKSKENLTFELIPNINNNKLRLEKDLEETESLQYTYSYGQHNHKIFVYFHTDESETDTVPLMFSYKSKYYVPFSNSDYFHKWKFIDINFNTDINDQISINLDKTYNELSQIDLSIKHGTYGLNPPKNIKLNESFQKTRVKVESDSKEGYQRITHRTENKRHIGYIRHNCVILNEHTKSNETNKNRKSFTREKNIDNVVTYFRKNDRRCCKPRLILLNRDESYAEFIYGYYHLTSEGYKFTKLSEEQRLEDLDSEDILNGQDIDPHLKFMKNTIQQISQDKPESTEDSTIKKIETESDSSGTSEDSDISMNEITELSYELLKSRSILTKDSNSQIKIKFKNTGTGKSTHVSRAQFSFGNFKRLSYKPDTGIRKGSESGPWELYKTTLFTLGKDITFNIEDSFLTDLFDSDFDDINIYYIESNLVLLVEFRNDFRNNYLVRTSRNSSIQWFRDNTFTYSDGFLLYKKLNEILFNLDSIILLIDSSATYGSSEIITAINNDKSIQLSHYQPDQISVTSRDLNSDVLITSNYICRTHAINPKLNESHQIALRLFMTASIDLSTPDQKEIKLFRNKNYHNREYIYYNQDTNSVLEVLFHKDHPNKPLSVKFNNAYFKPQIGEGTCKTNWIKYSPTKTSLSNQQSSYYHIFETELCNIKDELYPLSETKIMDLHNVHAADNILGTSHRPNSDSRPIDPLSSLPQVSSVLSQPHIPERKSQKINGNDEGRQITPGKSFSPEERTLQIDSFSVDESRNDSQGNLVQPSGASDAPSDESDRGTPVSTTFQTHGDSQVYTPTFKSPEINQKSSNGSEPGPNGSTQSSTTNQVPNATGDSPGNGNSESTGGTQSIDNNSNTPTDIIGILKENWPAVSGGAAGSVVLTAVSGFGIYRGCIKVK